MMRDHELNGIATQSRPQGHNGAHVMIKAECTDEVRLDRHRYSQLRPGTIDIGLGADDHFVGGVGQGRDEISNPLFGPTAQKSRDEMQHPRVR